MVSRKSMNSTAPSFLLAFSRQQSVVSFERQRRETETEKEEGGAVSVSIFFLVSISVSVFFD
jgi:hypothetical protein